MGGAPALTPGAENTGAGIGAIPTGCEGASLSDWPQLLQKGAFSAAAAPHLEQYIFGLLRFLYLPQHQRACDDVVQALFSGGKADHEKSNEQDDRREDLGEEPPSGSAKADATAL